MTLDVFELRDAVIGDYEAFVKGFLNIRDDRIQAVVEETLADGLLWPEPWLSLNPKFTSGGVGAGAAVLRAHAPRAWACRIFESDVWKSVPVGSCPKTWSATTPSGVMK